MNNLSFPHTGFFKFQIIFCSSPTLDQKSNLSYYRAQIFAPKCGLMNNLPLFSLQNTKNSVFCFFNHSYIVGQWITWPWLNHYFQVPTFCHLYKVVAPRSNRTNNRWNFVFVLLYICKKKEREKSEKCGKRLWIAFIWEMNRIKVEVGNWLFHSQCAESGA